jgi:replicative DNA helicase
MNFENALLLRAIDDNDWKQVVAHSLTERDFTDLDNRTLFTYLQNHYLQHGELPTPAFLRAHFPDYNWQEVADDKLSALIAQVRSARVYAETMQIVTRHCNASGQDSSQLAKDPIAAYRKMTNELAELGTLLDQDHDHHIVQQGQEIAHDYEQRATDDNLATGIPWPWGPLNEATQGIHPGNLVFIYGRPKSLKTWVLLNCAVTALSHGKRVVFASQEMDHVEIRDRVICIFSSLDYKAFLHGKLTPNQYQDFKDNLEAWKKQPPFVVTRLQQRGAMAVMEFRSKLAEYEADVGFFDAVYLAGDEWKDMVTITRHLKRLAADMKIPILGTCQENRTGQTAYSDSFLQDCDVLIRTKRGEDEIKYRELVLELPAMRRAQLESFTINAVPATDFSEKYKADADAEHSEHFLTEDQPAPKRRAGRASA